MATWVPTKEQDRLIQPPNVARNGQLVSAELYAQIARAQNHCMGYRRKWLGGLSQPLLNIENLGAAATVAWQQYFRTGHGVKEIYVRMLLAGDDTGLAGGTPTVKVGLYDPTTLLAGISFTRNVGLVDDGAGSLTDVQDNFVEASGTLTVSDDTAYGLSYTTEDGARVISATVWEVADKPVDDTTSGAVDPRYSVGDPILDGKALAMAQGQTELLRSNRHHLITWASYGTSAITNNTSTYKNIIDGSSTSVSAATPGWYIQNAYCNTLSRTGVPCVFAVYATATLNGGVVQLTDGTNTLTTGNVTSVGWYTVAGTIPAAAATKYDVHAKGDAGGGAITVSAIALLEYE